MNAMDRGNMRHAGDEHTGVNVSAAILAGGKSSRMGQDKALMEIRGKCMIKHVLDAVSKYVGELMIISSSGSRTGAYDFLKVPVHPDAVVSCGPLAGIYTALHHCTGDHCLVVACDLPFLSTALIKFLVDNCAGHDVFACESEAGVEPLCAVYSKACLPAVEQQLQQKEHKVSDLFARVNTKVIRLGTATLDVAPGSLLNINTKDEFVKASGCSETDS